MSADDVALFDRAAELAGGLSAAVASGLRLFVAARGQERGVQKMVGVEVEVSDGPVSTMKRFAGRQLLRFETQDGSRSMTYRVYATSGGQIAVYWREDPNWRLFVSPAEHAPVWNDPRTWSEDWWRSGQRTLSVFPNAAAMENEFPPELVQATMTALTDPDIEDLDI